MSQKVVSKILVDRSEYFKLKEYERQINSLNAEKKNQLKLITTKTDQSESNVNEQSGTGEVKIADNSFDANITDQFIQKISDAVALHLSNQFELVPKKTENLSVEQTGQGPSGKKIE